MWVWGFDTYLMPLPSSYPVGTTHESNIENIKAHVTLVTTILVLPHTVIALTKTWRLMASLVMNLY